MKVSMYEYGDNPCVKDCEGMDAEGFRNFSAEVLRRSGFTDVTTPGGKNGDEGINIYAKKGGKSYGIQCKKYTDAELSTELIEFVDELAKRKGQDAGMIITTRTFTKKAVNLADLKKMILWDRNRLQERIADTFPEYTLDYFRAQKNNGKKFDFARDGKIILMYIIIFIVFMALSKFR